jgi:Uma2 family endonuclease
MVSEMATQHNPLMSVRQYLELLQKSDVRYEFWDGEVVAMAGASLRHNQITMNIGGLAWQQLRGKDCTAAQSDQLVKTTSKQRYLFPDVVIHCKKGRIEKSFVEALVDPVVIFEVLSPSTERIDRTEKFESYSKIESLKELVLVSQDRQIVEHFYRESAAKPWYARHLFEEEHELELRSVGCKFKVRDIYEGVEWPENEFTQAQPTSIG